MERILVTGGAGFIGSHLIEKLVEKGKSVVVIDDLSNGALENLNDVEKEIEVVQYDVSMSLEHIQARVGKLDGIFHLACHPRSFSLEKPFRDLDVNVRGTLNVLELARQNNNCKVVFTSNSGIYGEPNYLPIDELHSDNPTTPYDANKLVAEYYCKIYNQIYGVPIGLVRLATVYGERQRTTPIWKPVITEFITKLLNDEQPTINWDGKQTRDFIYVDDVVSGLLKAFNEDTKREIFILGTDMETSIRGIYDTICAILGTDIEPLKGEKAKGDIRRMEYSYVKAKRWLKFEPAYDIQKGLEHYIKWMIVNKEE